MNSTIGQRRADDAEEGRRSLCGRALIRACSAAFFWLVWRFRRRAVGRRQEASFWIAIDAFFGSSIAEQREDVGSVGAVRPAPAFILFLRCFGEFAGSKIGAHSDDRRSTKTPDGQCLTT